MERLREFFRDKKHIKTVIIAVIIIATVVGVISTITITRPEDAIDDATSIVDVSQDDASQPNDSGAGSTDPDSNNLLEGDAAFTDSHTDSVSVGKSGGDGSNISHQDSTPSSNPSGAAPSLGSDNSALSGPVSVVCTISIDCRDISGNGALSAAGNPQLEPYAANPYILPATTIEVRDSNNDGRISVEEALKQTCNSHGIQYEFKGQSYLKGMNYLYEFNAGPNSGWMYQVDGVIPNKGCNNYYLRGQEDIRWYYVISY